MRLLLFFLPALLIAACSPRSGTPNEMSCTDSLATALVEQLPPKDSLPDTSANVSDGNSAASTAMEATETKTTFTLGIFENPKNPGGYGYDVMKEGKVIIRQPTIPAISGNKGFASKEDAEKVGNLMVIKIENGIMPPTISIEDLDSLKIKR